MVSMRKTVTCPTLQNLSEMFRMRKHLFLYVLTKGSTESYCRYSSSNVCNSQRGVVVVWKRLSEDQREIGGNAAGKDSTESTVHIGYSDWPPSRGLKSL